jgi:Flp pilus assembly protein TadD
MKTKSEADDEQEARDKPFLLTEGLRLLDAKDPVAAISAFQAVIRLDPESPGAYSGIGQAFLDAEEYEGARVAFTKSIALQPTSARYVMLGSALVHLGQNRLAFRAFRNALRISPEDEEAVFNAIQVLRLRHPKFAARFAARTSRQGSA